jgi:putative ABC transport system permease protein
MLRNALITSYRTIVNNKIYTIINLAGLVLGLTASFILLVYAINETSYNKCFSKSDRIYRIIYTDSKGISLPSGNCMIKTVLADRMPECLKIARIIHETSIPGKVKINIGGKLIETNHFICADPELFDMLDIRLIRGKADKSSQIQNQVYLSESAMEKYFPRGCPLFGNIEFVNSGRVYHLTLAGIFEDLPWNSTLKADFIAGLGFYEKLLTDLMPDQVGVFKSFDDFSVESLCEFKPGTDIKTVTVKIPELFTGTGWNEKGTRLSFQPMRDIYLHSADFWNNFHLKGNRLSVYTYSWLAVFILLLAGINYAILSTARSALRFKEIGIRKVLGALKSELRIQILIESVLLTFMAFPLALFFMGLIDPRITGMPDYTITMYAGNMIQYIVFFSGITLLIGILSGLYVAIYLAGLNPINALKARFFSPKKFSLSKVFIGFQLFITLSLLICMITIYSQIRLCYVNNLSISRENILLIPVRSPDYQKYSILKSKLAKINGILLYTGTGLFLLPSTSNITLKIRVPNFRDPVSVEMVHIDRNFFSTLGIPITLGRDFDTASINRNEVECIINEEAAKVFGLTDHVGVILNGAKIVGIVNNFNLHTLHDKIPPTNYLYNPFAVNTVIIHYQQGTEKSVIRDVQKAWQQAFPKKPFEFSFYCQELRSAYQKENNFVIAVAIFTILAFIITGMGLFGLALLISERKTKETAIRKVFGASNVQIIVRMQKEFFIYTGIATLFAIPVSWLLMELWLKEFYYRVEISVWVMLLSVTTVTLFVSAILLMRTIKVLRSNPINALKYE